MIRWDEWRGNLDGRITFWSKTLFRWRGRKVCLHKFIAIDDSECFHTHPARAIRIILWNGYIEEVEGGALKTWWPGMIGLIRPAYSHRVHALRTGRPSYSLWLRGKNTTPIELRGEGWPQ